MNDDERTQPSSQYNADAISRFFDAYGVREWERLVQDPNTEVSLHVHNHYLAKYIEPGQRVLEIGAGAGRFTQYLAQLGTRIVVADISPGQLALNKQHARHYGYSQAIEAWVQLDMCDMSMFTGGAFDRVVAYGGPLSYVLDQRDRALAECTRVLKRRGLLLLSVISLWGSAHRQLLAVLETPAEINRRITDTGDIGPGMFEGREQHFHMFRAQELRQWLEGAGLEIVALSASDCLSTAWGDRLGEVRKDAQKWNELLRMEVEACAEAGSLDMGMHTIAVVREAG